MAQVESEAEDEAEPDRTSPQAQIDEGRAGSTQGTDKLECAVVARLKQKQVCQPQRCTFPACIALYGSQLLGGLTG